jgi:hypothetical protein
MPIPPSGIGIFDRVYESKFQDKSNNKISALDWIDPIINSPSCWRRQQSSDTFITFLFVGANTIECLESGIGNNFRG